LAHEGRAYQRDAVLFIKADDTIDGNLLRRRKHTCPMSYNALGTWWRVDFIKLVKVFAITIIPGKFEKY